MAKTLQLDTLHKALEAWGQVKQIDMAIEEMGELIVAINHHRRGRCGVEAVQEEIADVAIALRQLAIIYGEQGVYSFERSKMARLKKRVEQEEKWQYGRF